MHSKFPYTTTVLREMVFQTKNKLGYYYHLIFVDGHICRDVETFMIYFAEHLKCRLNPGLFVSKEERRIFKSGSAEICWVQEMPFSSTTLTIKPT